MNNNDIVRQALEAFRQQNPVSRDAADFEISFVLKELRDAGVEAAGTEDLKRNLALWRRSIPTLKRCLDEIKSPRAKEVVVRLLSVPFAKGVEPLLLRIMRLEDDELLRWAAGNGLDVLASDQIASELIAIALDKRLGWSRQMVVRALGKLKDPRAIEAAISCLADEDVLLHALSALARMKKPEAIPNVQPFLHHSRAAVRKEARKALERLGKVKASSN